MTENNIITKSDFKNGFFATVPEETSSKAILLCSSKTNRIIRANHKVTPREVLLGKYDEKIEIDITQNTYFIVLTVSSEDINLSFDVKVSVNASISKPLKFYENSITNLTEYIKNRFRATVKKITKQYSVVDYKDMDEHILNELKDQSIKIECLNYTVFDVDCQPNKNSIDFIKQINEAKMKRIVEESKNEEAQKLKNTTFEEAINKQVLEGTITHEQAITKIRDYKQQEGIRIFENIKNYKDFMVDLNNSDIINDAQVADYVKEAINGLNNLLPQSNKQQKEVASDSPNDLTNEHVVSEESPDEK